MLNSNDTKRINKKHCADNAEIIGASLSKLALLENTLSELAKQITDLEAKLEAAREAAIELKSIKALDKSAVAQGVVDELLQRLTIGSNPVAKGLTHATIPEAQAAKLRRKRDL